MKIKNIKAFEERMGLTRPYSIAYKTVTDVTCLFIEIELENGLKGYGSANPSKWVVGETVEEAINRMKNYDFSFLIGRDIRNFHHIIQETARRFFPYPGSQAALDIALYDIFLKFLDVSATQYFGRSHTSLLTSITIGIKNVPATIEEAKEYIERGFKVLKVKTGLNPEEDAERILKIKEIKNDILIRVDANQGYDVDDLKSFVKLTEKVDLELIEQPFKVADFESYMAETAPEVAKFVVADESLKNDVDALHLVSNVRNCSIYNIKLMKCGGVFPASRIAQISEISNKRLMWGCNDESIVSISAALHLALSYKNTSYIDLDGSFDIEKDLVEGGFLLKEGHLFPIEGPGFGFRWLAE